MHPVCSCWRRTNVATISMCFAFIRIHAVRPRQPFITCTFCTVATPRPKFKIWSFRWIHVGQPCPPPEEPPTYSPSHRTVAQQHIVHTVRPRLSIACRVSIDRLDFRPTGARVVPFFTVITVRSVPIRITIQDCHHFHGRTSFSHWSNCVSQCNWRRTHRRRRCRPQRANGNVYLRCPMTLEMCCVYVRYSRGPETCCCSQWTRIETYQRYEINAMQSIRCSSWPATDQWSNTIWNQNTCRVRTFALLNHATQLTNRVSPTYAGIPTSKQNDDSPIELHVEAKAQWNLQRRDASIEIQPPLQPENWLLKNRMDAKDKFAYGDGDMSDNEDRWLSQVEIVTSSGPHRRLWMGPQFIFKTYNTPSG